MEQTSRILGMAFAGLALCISVYMGLLALGDWAARYALSGEGAHRFAAAACGQITGCKSLSIRAGYDWRNARRRVLYRIEANPGGMGHEEALEVIRQLADRESGMLGGTLRGESVLDMPVPSPSAPSVKNTSGRASLGTAQGSGSHRHSGHLSGRTQSTTPP